MEDIKYSGEVDLKIYENGVLIEHCMEHNLVVNLGKELSAKMLGGAAGIGPVTKVGVGTSGTAASVSDTALTAMFSKNVDSVSYPAINQVQFAFTLGASDANGMTIQELGLLTATNTLFARKTRSAISKTSAMTISGLWTITIN